MFEFAYPLVLEGPTAVQQLMSALIKFAYPLVLGGLQQRENWQASHDRLLIPSF